MSNFFEKWDEVIEDRENNRYYYDDDDDLEEKLKEAFKVFFEDLDDLIHGRKKIKVRRKKNDLPQFDEDGKRIIYVYDKNFDPKNYNDPFLNCTFKKHPDSDILDDQDAFDFNYKDSNKIIKISDYRRKM